MNALAPIFLRRGTCRALFLSLLVVHTLCGQTASDLPDTTKAVIDWVRQQAMPIQYVEAGNDFADLKPLKRILKEVKVVGLGEATHGTREFFQMKHRLFEFLVKEMGYTVFTLEASYASCQPINDYVLAGKGDQATVLTGQGYSPWDTEEFAALIDWMRSYNQTVSEEKKVKFYGLDVAYHQPARQQVRAYLQQYAPEQVPAVDSLFEQLAVADQKWPMRRDEFREKADQVMPPLRQLISYLQNQRTRLVAASSSDSFEQTVRSVKVIEQLLQTITTYSLRAQFMGENLLYLMEQMPRAKFVVSAHNRHINLQDHVGNVNLGHRLREKLGEQYYAVGFETYEGSYQTRVLLPEGSVLANFREDVLAPAPEGSLPWMLARAGVGNMFLNVRTPIRNPMVKHWWSTPQVVRDVPWVYGNDPSGFFAKVPLTQYYDGLLYIGKTSRARPTHNAQELAAKGIGF